MTEPNSETYLPNLKWFFENHPSQRSRMEENAHYTYGYVLEVGANDGWVSCLIKGQGKEVIATDISKTAIKIAHGRGLDVLVCDAQHLPFKDASFDSVLGGELLEHLSNMGYALAEMQRVTKKRIIISLPLEYWKGDPTHKWDILWRGVMWSGKKFNEFSIKKEALAFTVLVLDRK